jgi:hypothetical protein
MSFSLLIFHGFVLLIIITRTKCAELFHDGCWFVKILFVVGLFIGSMWIPNSAMAGYMQFTRAVSTVFLMY